MHSEINGDILNITVSTFRGDYYDFFDGVTKSILQQHCKPVTAKEGLNVMWIIEVAIQSST